MCSGFFRCPALSVLRRFEVSADLVKALKAHLYHLPKPRPRKQRLLRSSVPVAMRSRLARQALSFRNIFHRALVFVPVVRFTAFSSLLCLAATLRSHRRGLASRQIPEACRFTKTVCPQAPSVSKATDFTQSIAILLTTINLSRNSLPLQAYAVTKHLR